MSDRIWLPMFTTSQKFVMATSTFQIDFGHGLFYAMMERVKWVKENSVDSVEVQNSGIFFDNPDDAFAYKMRWL